MKATQQLNKLGQSLWLDNITRQLLDSGTLKKYIAELSVTGLTSNPTIFDHAMTHGNSYDDDMARLMSSGISVEDAFFEMAIDDLRRAADLFAEIHQRTSTVDGWVSLEVSPLLAYDALKTAAVAKQ
jgi:transaldolase